MKFISAGKIEYNFKHSPEVIKKIKTFDIEKARRYQEKQELLTKLSKKHRIPEDQIFLEYGIIGIIDRVFNSINNTNKKILLPDTTYHYFRELAKHNKTKVDFFKTLKLEDSFYYDIEDILKKLKNNPDILVLVDPECPLGSSLKKIDLDRIMKNVPKKTLVMIDQEHEGYRSTEIKDVKKLIKLHPNLLFARSFSKFYGLASLRIAYALCGKNVKSMINFIDPYLGINQFAQEMAIASLNSESHYKKNIKEIKKQKNRITDAVNLIPGCKVYKTDTIFSVVDVKPSIKSKLVKRFKKFNVDVRWLGYYDNKYKNVLRVNTTTQKDTSKIIKALRF